MARQDFPGVNCENCESNRDDGVVPDCEREGGECPIPPLSPRSRRIVEAYQALGALVDLGIGPSILEIYAVNNRDDLRLLGVVHEVLKPEPTAPTEEAKKES